MSIHQTVFIVTAIVALCPARAFAQAAACTEDYEKAQEEKANGHLIAALAHLRGCVNPDCPKFIRDDCGRWMDQAELALPTVVFAVRQDGADRMQVEVTCDGSALVHALDGKAVPVDPGMHSFSFSISGFSPVVRQLLIREGERNRIVEVDFRSPGASEPTNAAVSAPASSGSHGGFNKRYLTYGSAGVGALGVAGFTLFAVLGSNQQGDLEKSCSPNCQSSQVDSVRTKYLVADTCLAVGLVSLGIATYLYLSNRGEESDSPQKKEAVSVGIAPRTGGSGGVLQLSTVF